MAGRQTLTTFDRIWAILVFAACVALVALNATRDQPPASTAAVRDSVSVADSVRAERFDSFAVQVVHAPADTLAIILRDRARRPPLRVVRVTDTIRDTVATTEDVGSSQSCEVVLSCHEARSLALRDSALVMLSDSLRGSLAVQDAVIDSLQAACTPRPSPRAAFGLGFVAGVAVCALF